jgi:hypothetical protein
MLSRFFAIVTWLINLFDPPPLASMNRSQKMSRALLVTLTLILSCILTAMLGAVGIFVVERGRHMLNSIPELLGGLGIIFTGVCVNAICVVVTDRKLLSPRP